MPAFNPKSVYIVLYFLRQDSRGNNKYHWGLFCTGSDGRSGDLFHATDAGRSRGLDLYFQAKHDARTNSNTLISALYVCPSAVGRSEIEKAVKAIPVMDENYLYQCDPREPTWTCRVWVKIALNLLQQYRYISLPATTDQIEGYAVASADKYVARNLNNSSVKTINETSSWLSSSSSRYQTTPMDYEYDTDRMDTSTHRSSRRRDPDAMETSRHGHSRR